MARSAARASRWFEPLPHSPASLALRYALFALAAMTANIVVQALAAAAYRGPLALWAALACGTVAGILPKYHLDKRWIFGDRATGASTHAEKFTRYTLTAVGTTLLFWATEFAFDRLGGGAWRYAGAALGLAIGYFAKYRLDQRFVFARAR